MKAIVNTEYGTPDVLQLKDVEKPIPKDDEVLVKVHATGLNAADKFMLSGKPYFIRMMTGGLRKPKNTILGADIAGVVEAVGRNITQFQPGDAVFGDISGCGWGGLAEYVTVPENVLVLKPKTMTYEEAAAVPMAAVTALQGLHQAKITPGQKVLVNGASGGVGTFAVQIAKSFDTEVTAVCSTRNVEMARSIGADHVIDYKQENFTRNGQQYDLILAVNGYHPIGHYKRSLTSTGAYVVAGGTMGQIFQGMLLGPLLCIGSNKTMGALTAQPSRDDLSAVKELIEANQVKSVIDQCYPLDEAADALRYLSGGHAQGKVVMMITN